MSKKSTEESAYAERLSNLQQVWWKKFFRVQAPYQWHLKHQDLGRTLDVGCGIGRNLATLGSSSVGVDHNEEAVLEARALGHNALTVEEWEKSEHRREASFDGILLAHVIEHLDREESIAILNDYLPYLKPGGKVFFICPQERGYASDETHIRFTDFDALRDLCEATGLTPVRQRSFPFPRKLGKTFIYNEFCLLALKEK